MITHDQALLAALAKIDTPTICNALEELVSPRQLIRFTTRPFVHNDHPDAIFVGYARTAMIRAENPSAMSPAERNALRVTYYEHVATAEPGPNIAVIQDLDSTPGTGAFWGEVQTTIHKALGVAGCVTNGSIRDLAMMAKGFPIIAGMINPSHAFVHVVAVGTTVSIHGMTVHDGELIHADRHGAVVIPHEVAARVPAAVELCARREKVILDAARAPGFGIATLREALRKMAEIH
ncbi:RraA family protein [Elioraea sp. Yellowstone]|jgi:regulator of RNase E activity RraA|uniref:RraA family protein n=1 Tax=Elioraea sp. Yellowstone TaxID=2592070 RepID=UPI00115460B8|nr:RraA family protein [Elioraea sp. Yellowstone]TQF83440.1 RraA family protein [Elioraea sp. Yellowstone]